MATVNSLVIQIEAQNDSAVQKINETKTAIERLGLEFAQTTAAYATARSDLVQLNKTLGNTKNRFQTLATAISNASERARVFKDHLDTINVKLSGVHKPMAWFVANLQSASGAIDNTASSFNQLASSVSTINNSARSAGAALSTIGKSTERAEKSAEKLGAANTRAANSTRQVGATSGVAAGSVRQYGAALDRAAVSQNRMARSAGQTNSAVQAFVNQMNPARFAVQSLGFALGGLFTVHTARNVLQVANTFQNMQNQMRAVTGATFDLAGANEKLFAIAQRTRQNFAETGNLFSRLVRVQGDLNMSSEELFDITESINKAIVLSGSSAMAAQAALVQLGQGLSAGALRGEELNSVMEQTPVLGQMLAKGLGMTSGEMRKFAAQGGLTAERVISAIQNMTGEIDQRFGNTVVTIDQAFTQLENAFMKYIADTDSASQATQKISAQITNLANNLPQAINGVLTVGEALAVLWGARIVSAGQAKLGMMLQVQRGTVMAAQAELHYTTAQLASEKATLKSALAEQKAAATAVRVAETQKLATGVTNTLTAARARLAAADEALILAENGVAAATARSSAAQAGAAAASMGVMARAGAGLMGMIGGIPGALLIAGYGLYSFADGVGDVSDQFNKAIPQTANLRDAINLLAVDVKKLSGTELTHFSKDATTNLASVEAEMQAIQDQIAEINKTRLENPISSFTSDTWDNVFGNSDSFENAQALQARLDELGVKANGLRDKAKEAATAIEGINEAAKQAIDADGMNLGEVSELDKIVGGYDEIQAAVNDYKQQLIDIEAAEGSIGEKIAARNAAAVAIEEKLTEIRNKGQTQYEDMLATYDEMYKSALDYKRAQEDILDSKMTEVQKEEILNRLANDRLDTLKDMRAELKQQLRDLDTADLKKRLGKSGGDTGNVNMDYIMRQGDFAKPNNKKASKEFENQARAVADAIKKGNISSDSLAMALGKLRIEIARKDSRFDKAGMEAVVAELGKMGLQSIEDESNKPLTAVEYKTLFDAAKADKEAADDVANTKRDETIAKLGNIDTALTAHNTSLDNVLKKLTSDPDKVSFGTIELVIPLPDGGKLASRITTNQKGAKILRDFMRKGNNDAARSRDA